MFEIDSCICEFGEELNLASFKLLAKSPNLSPRQIFPLYGMHLHTYIHTNVFIIHTYETVIIRNQRKCIVVKPMQLYLGIAMYVYTLYQ